MAAAEDFTTDTLLRGRVTLLQPTRGFRSSLDPVLLAAFVHPPFGRFVDIGCGTGAVAFLLAAGDPASTGVAVEIQPRLASLAAAGLARNSFADRIEILPADIRRAVGRPPLEPGTFDTVATNPPYRTLIGGILSPHPERAQANHEVTLTLDEWLDVAATLVRPGGRVAVVYAAERASELLAGLRRRRLAPVRVRMVHPLAERPAARILVESCFNGPPEPVVEPPLVVHESSGGYTAEAQRMIGDRAVAPSVRW
jgi:tRNA1(Val) A37 N6-methylase TrmN6